MFFRRWKSRKKSTLDHLGSEVFCHNKLLPGKGYLGLEKQNDHEKFHTYQTYHDSTFGTPFTQQRHQDLAAGKEGIAFKFFKSFKVDTYGRFIWKYNNGFKAKHSTATE